jgi:hypothetical protein
MFCHQTYSINALGIIGNLRLQIVQRKTLRFLEGRSQNFRNRLKKRVLAFGFSYNMIFTSILSVLKHDLKNEFFSSNFL